MPSSGVQAYLQKKPYAKKSKSVTFLTCYRKLVTIRNRSKRTSIQCNLTSHASETHPTSPLNISRKTLKIVQNRQKSSIQNLRLSAHFFPINNAASAPRRPIVPIDNAALCVSGCIWMYPDASGCIRMQSGCIRMHSDAFAYIHVHHFIAKLY